MFITDDVRHMSSCFSISLYDEVGYRNPKSNFGDLIGSWFSYSLPTKPKLILIFLSHWKELVYGSLPQRTCPSD